MGLWSGIKGLGQKAKDFLNRLNPFSKKDGKKVVQELLKDKIDFKEAIKKKIIRVGSLVYFEYDPKDKTQIWDYKPLIFVLKITPTHILGCNYHWIDMKERIELIELALNMNRKPDGTFNTPLDMSYPILKMNMEEDYKLSKCLHLYIRDRTSKKCVVIDPKYILDVARLKLEHFQ